MRGIGEVIEHGKIDGKDANGGNGYSNARFDPVDLEL